MPFNSQSLSRSRRRRGGSAAATDGGRRWKIVGTLAVAGLIVGGGLGVAAATTGSSGGTAGSPGTISCPTVADKLPAPPAAAKAEVDRNLALLNTQLSEANNRLVSSVGQGGANFVQNAIVGPLKGKRDATIDRIRIAYNRQGVVVSGLEGLGTCSVDGSGVAAPAEPEEVPAAPPAGGDNAGGNNAGGNNAGGNNAGGNNAGAGAGTVNCPTVADKLPAVPAAAQAEVTRNLALLETQIAEADARIANSVGQGGANFVQNAVIGPLKGKRDATIDRIRIAFNRQGVVVSGLDGLGTCSVNS